MSRELIVSATAVALLAPSGAVLAQENSTQSADRQSLLEEVVVSATRREVRLQDVPISITAFSPDELNEKGIVGYEGLAFETPGAILNKPTSNFNTFSVRGIATNGYGANLQNTVAVYIDELPISANGNSTQLDPTLFDMERVEFLRGPQGTLFGSGSLAGAVRLLTKSPDLSRFDAATLVDFGVTDGDSFRQRYHGMVNVPLVDNELALRVVGFYRNEDGWVTNIGTGRDNANTLENFGGRAIMLWQPNERFSLRFMWLHEESDPEDSQMINPALDPRRETRSTRKPDKYGGELDSYNATLNIGFGFADFTSSSTYSRYDQSFIIDLDGTFNHLVPFALDAFAYDDAFVQEMRLVSNTAGNLDWVLGGFYYYKRRDVDLFYRSDAAYLAAHGMTGLPDEYYQRAYTYAVSHEVAGFGELTWRFNDNFWLTGGIRYGQLDVRGVQEGGYNSNYLVNALFGIDGPLTMVPLEYARGEKGVEEGPSYKLSISYKPMPNMTMYGTYSTGFRTPIVNARAGLPSAVDPTDLVIPYGASSDEIDNYEIGLKGTWLNGRLSANLAAYLIYWSNIQVQANRRSDSIQFAANIGKARSKGIEFELFAAPLKGLEVGLNGSFNDAKVTELTPEEATVSGAVVGAKLAFPEFQGAAFLRYSRDVTPTVKGFFATYFQYVDGFPNQFPNVPGNPNQQAATYGHTESFENVNVSLGAQFGSHWKATLYAENLFDDHSITYLHPEAFADARASTMRPRTVGIRINYDY
jgi:iron complex outermembrane receptor protein